MSAAASIASGFARVVPAGLAATSGPNPDRKVGAVFDIAGRCVRREKVSTQARHLSEGVADPAQVELGGTERQMPLAAYFRNVGAVLLALLFVANLYWPTPPVVAGASEYSPVIRIHTDRKWPERMIFDTTTVIASAKPVALQAAIAASPDAGNAPASRIDVSGAREALAMLPRPDPLHAQAVNQNKRHLKQKAAARRKHARHQIVLASRQRQFGWFEPRYW